MRRAYLIDFADSEVIDGLNAIRWLANPGPRRRLHVTLRGPYPLDEDPTTPAVLAAVNAELAGREITLAGVDRFKDRGHRTVFLHVPDALIGAMGDARGQFYTAHATIYDGKDRALSKALESRLTRLPELNVQVSAVTSVTVGRVEHPLDEQVLAAEIVKRALASGTHTGTDVGAAIAPVRLRLIESVVDELRRRGAQP